MKGTWPALLFAMTFPTVASLVYFVGVVGPGQGPNLLLQSCYGGSKIVQFSLPILWVGLVQRVPFWPTRPGLRGIGPGAAFGLLTGALMLLLYYAVYRDSSIMLEAREQVRAKVEELGLASSGRFLILTVFISVAHSLLEEYYWRWFVFKQLKGLLALWPAIVLSGLAFMGHHVVILGVYFPHHFWAATGPFSLAVAAGGIFWAWLYHRTGSIWSVWISHTLVDCAIMVVGYDLLFG